MGEKLNHFLVNNFNNLLRWEERVLDTASAGKLSVSEFHVIEAVIAAMSSGENTMSEVARRLGVTVGTLTTSVKTLSRKGFILREKGADDRRTVRLFPTHAATEANSIHDNFHKQMVSGVMESLDQNQLIALATALGVLGDWFNSLESGDHYVEIPEEDDFFSSELSPQNEKE
ncbi:MAG: MarR family winged helix-turn-helix transcriptional regulator [Angelakisella sp.]